MSEPSSAEFARLPSNRVVVVALYLVYLATLGRTLASAASGWPVRAQLPVVLGLELTFLLLYSLAHFAGILWRPGIRERSVHLYFTGQCALLAVAYLYAPQLDYLANLFILLSFQAALSRLGPRRWIWIAAMAALTAGLQVFSLGLLRGLGLGLVATVSEIILAAYVVVNREATLAQAKGQAMLLELQTTNHQLERYAGQVEELAGIQERNRLARQIHDSVSQTLFSIALNTRAAQLLLEKNPTKVRAQLEELQSLVQSALAEMRGLIAQLRQPPES